MKNDYPEGAQLQQFIKRRRYMGVFWRSLFLLATTLGVLVLMVLLLTIINDSFGFVAMQYKTEPETILLQYHRNRILEAPQTEISENGDDLAARIRQQNHAIGILSMARSHNELDTLRLAPIDGVVPNVQTVTSGDYMLSRPLFLVTTQETLQEQGPTAIFTGYYLRNAYQIVEELGYFTAPEQAKSQSWEHWQQSTGLPPSAISDHLQLAGDISMVSNAALIPLTQAMIKRLQQDDASLQISVEAGGSAAGLRALCEGHADIAMTSRPVLREEWQSCQRNHLTPIAFRIATDAIAVVISQENTWVDGLTKTEVQHLFTDASNWSDVRSSWPTKPVIRWIPGPDSETLDVFVMRVFGDDLQAQSNETLIALLEAHVSKGVLRRFEKEQPLNTRSHEELHQLVVERVLKPTILETWSLYDSLFHREQIQAFLEQEPRAKLEFRRWVTWDFITSRQSSRPEFAGVRTAILGSLWVVLITLLFSVPVGVGAAIYLEEYGSGNWLDQLIENNINNLAGVPSIIYGMLGLAVFVRALEPLTSGALFGFTDPTTANGRTILAAGLTLGLLILPIIIINAREAIRAVPRAFREASYALGATKWQTIWYHVLPNAVPGILTGSILAISRAFGETAPLVVIGASTAIFVDPSGPFSKFTTLPIQIYQWTARPQAAFQNLAAAAIIVLLILLLALNAAAVLLRNKYQRSY